MPVFALLSDFAPGVRSAYLGLDNLKVGRTAAWMIALAAGGPGKVAVFVGGHRWHGPRAARNRLSRLSARTMPRNWSVLETMVNLETRQLTYEATLTLLARQPDLRGIYVAGGGMEGAIAALRKTRTAGEVALVVSALTPESRAGLAEGLVTMVIDTPLDKLCRVLIGQMVRAARAPMPLVAGPPQFPAPDLHVAESL